MAKDNTTGWVIEEPGTAPSNPAKWLVPLTSLVIFVQLMSGGTFLLADNDLGHVATGLVVIAVAWFGVAGAMTLRPPGRSVRLLAIVTMVLVLGAALFASKDTILEHYGLAVAAFGTSAANSVLVLARGRRGGTQPPSL